MEKQEKSQEVAVVEMGLGGDIKAVEATLHKISLERQVWVTYDLELLLGREQGHSLPYQMQRGHNYSSLD